MTYDEPMPWQKRRPIPLAERKRHQEQGPEPVGNDLETLRRMADERGESDPLAAYGEDHATRRDY